MKRSAEQVTGKGRGKSFTTRLLCSASLTAVALLALPSTARAADDDRYWDPNATAPNSGGNGTWDTSSSTWSPNADGVSGPYTPWDNSGLDNAIFGGVNGTTATVTLGTPITAHNLNIISGTTYTLTGSTLTLAGATPTITTDGTATINSIIAGNSGLTKAGAGVLTLTGANTFSGGVNVTGGTLSVGGDSALGNASNAINLSSGAGLTSTGALNNSRVVTLLSGLSIIGGGVGSAHLTGAGGITLAGITTLNDNTNDFTGPVYAVGYNLTFTSIGNLGEKSSLGAATTAANGLINIGSGGNGLPGGGASAIYIGDGDTSNRDWNMRVSGSGTNLINQGTGTLTLTGNFAQNGPTGATVGFIAQTADLELLGVISGGRPISFSGGGTARTITLGGSNDFTTPITIQSVTVKASTLANGGLVSSLGVSGNISLNSAILSYTGSGGGTNRVFSLNGASSILNDGTGSLALTGAIVFNPANPGDTITLGGSSAGGNTLSGVLSGNGNVVMNGAGTWLLSGTNTYVGSTTVNGGSLQMGSDQALGAPNALIVNGGTLDLGTHDLEVTSLAGTGGSVALTGADLTVNGAASTSNNTTYAGSITGTGGLSKRGTSTLTLTGQSTYTGATTLNSGTLALDFSAGGAPTTNILSGLSALNMTGGTLTLTGAAGVANGQTFNGLNVGVGNNRIIMTTGAGGSMVLALGALNHTGGLLDFTKSATSDITTTSADGALGWATINGSDYAQVTSGHIVAFTNYAEKDNASTWANGDVVADTGGAANTPFIGTVTGNIELGGLKYTAGAGSGVTIGAGNTLGVDGTIIVSSSVNNAGQTITGGSITGAAGGGAFGVLDNSTGTGTFTIGSTIVDNGPGTSFVKGGSGRVALTGANSYTGGTTISGGTLAIDSVANGGSASSIGASSSDSANLVLESGTLEYTGVGAGTSDRGLTLVNGGPSRTIQVDGGNLSLGGVVVGPDDAGFSKTGAGTLTLANAANTYTGVTTVSGGILSVNTLANGGVASGIGASSADSANLLIQTGGTLQYTGATTSTDRGFTINGGAGATVDVVNAGTVLTIGGTVDKLGLAPLHKAGAGTLVLAGTNVYTGTTFIDNGTLQAGSNQAFGVSNIMTFADVAGGVTLDLNGFDNKVNALVSSGANGGTVRLGNATLTVGGTNATFSGTITGAGGVYKDNSNTQALLGCNNTYTGVTNVHGGTLSVDCLANGGQASGIGASTNTSANLNLSGGILAYTGGSVTIDRGITLTSTGVISVVNAATVLGISGPIVGGALRKDGAGTLVLSGTNTYNGITTVTGGILRAGSNKGIGDGALGLNDTAGVLVDLNNFDTAVGGLNGGGTTGGNVTLGTATLTIASNSGSGSYAGAISGSGGIFKGGIFTQALTGCGSSYTGTTFINGGVLTVSCLTNGGTNSAIGASSNAAGNLVLNGGSTNYATLIYNGAGDSTDRLFTLGSGISEIASSGTGAIVFTNTGTIAFSTPGTAQTLTLGGTNTGNNSLAAQITNNGAGVTSLTKTDAGTWILNNPNSTYTGVTTISGGVLGVDKLANGGLASSIGASLAAASNLVIGNSSTLRYTGSGDITNRLFTLSSGTTFIESSGTGAIVFTDTGPVTLAGTNTAHTIAVGGTNTGNNTLAGSIGDAGTGVTVLAKNDAGTWLLTGNNTYTGNTNINAGTLILGNGGTTGSIASASVNNLGVLGFNRSDTLTYAGVIGGTGSVQQIGTGSTILTGTNTYTGATTVSAGDLTLQSGGKITATSSLTVANGGEMIVDGAGSQLFATASVISSSNVDSSTLTVRNGGSASFTTMDLANANNSTATLNIIGAGSQVTSAGGTWGKLGTATINILDGAKLTSSGASTLVGGQFSTNAEALVTVSGAGSEWDVTSALNARRGSITVAAGGVVSAGSATIGATLAGLNSPAMAVTVTGAGSRFETTGGLNLLNGAGTGALTIADGGVVDVGSGTLAMGGTGQATLNIGAASGNTAIAGGTLDASSVTTTATSTITFNHTDPGLVFAAAISGAGHVNQLSGTTILTGDSSYTGGTVIGGGTLQLGNGGTTGSVAGDVTDNGTLAFDHSNLVTYAGLINGTGSVHQMGSGTLILSGTNTYAGGTTIDGGGTVQITSDANLGDAGGGVTFDNGTLQVLAPITTARDFTLAGNGTINTDTDFNANSSLTVTGDITGPGALTKDGIGKLTILGDATYTGGTTISRGNLLIGNGGTTGSIIGDIIVSAGTGLSFNRSDSYTYAGSVSGSGGLTIGGGIANFTGNSNFSGSVNIAGTVAIGSELRITTGNTFTTTGATSVNRGTLTVSGAGSTYVSGSINAVAPSGPAVVDVENGGVVRTTTAGLALRGSGTPSAASLTVSGTGSLLDLAGALTMANVGVTNTARMTISAGGTVRSIGANVIGATGGNTDPSTFTITGAGSNWTSTGTLAMSNGSFSLLDGGAASFASATIGSAPQAATVLLSDANSSFATTGDLTLGTGTGTGIITLSDAARLTVGGTFTLADVAGSTGVLNIGGAEGQGAEAAGFYDSPTLAFGAGTGRLNFNHIETNYTFAAAMSGAGTINQVAGVTNLTGNSTAFAGTTNVSGGTLKVNGTLGNATSVLNVLSGGTLGGAGTIGGNVSIADGILAPGNSPGTLTIAGNLALAATSVLNFEFGEAGVAGGALNDLVNVGGNLTLDGTINVTEPAGGTFGVGVYRVFNYGGTLTDNGLAIGTLPNGQTVQVQTAIAGQVNLVNTTGLAYSFWDGDAGPKGNNVINGGDGIWHLAGADANWTNATGAANDAWSDGTTAIFAGAAGTVTVDNTLGNVTVAGMQFATDAYRIIGNDVTLLGPQAAIQVGDGSAAGAGYVATIDANLTGASKLVKTDLGKLVLTGVNTYTGGTEIDGGSIEIASDLNLGAVTGGLSFNGGGLNVTASMTTNRDIALDGAGTIAVVAGATVTLGGDISGAGSLTIATGASTNVILTGDATHTGGTALTGSGTLQIGNGGTLGSIAGDIVTSGTVRFDRSDSYTYAGSISGIGSMSVDAGILTLTGNSSLTGGLSTIGIRPGAELRVNAGNTVSTANNANMSAGSTLTVSGSGSTFAPLRILASTGGTVNVLDGGVITTGGPGISLGSSGTGPASLTISGAGSLVNSTGNSQIQVGTAQGVTATITISDGGTLRSGMLNLIGATAGNLTAPTVTITGAGSNWTSTGVLGLRNGQFSVVDGGAASFASATLGTAPQAATLLVSGTNSSFTTTGDLTLGTGSGTGVLTLTDGGHVTVGGTFVMASAATATGVLNIGGAEGAAEAATGQFDAATLNLGSATSRINFNHNDPDYVFATVISGGGAVNQAGSGTTILTGASNYSGATNVHGGTLLVNGDQTNATGLTSVNAGGTLGGVGIIGGNVIVADGGTLAPGDATGPGTLAIKGNLALSSGTTLNYDFGRSNVVGGPLNDLTKVGDALTGDLTLDGTINVAVSSGGSFDVGLYRVISYGGALTDNGLDIGSVPSTNVFAQTSVAGQVNLVNADGANVNFWEGTLAPRGDGHVGGGDGVWQNVSGNDNWTLIDGSLNAPFQDNSFAIFAAAPGTVTVDDSLGAVTASGMQFASNGYVIDGNALALAPDATVRVGDGTADGAGYVATIKSALTATGNFTKTDLGTLVLTGADTFSASINVTDGTLKVADGGVVNSTGDVSSAIFVNANLAVTGSGSQFLTTLDMVVGRETDKSSVRVDNQGQLTTSRIFLGDNPGAPATSAIDLTVDGAGSSITTGGLIAGRGPGTVSINVTNGGHLTADGASLGEDSSFTVAGAIHVKVDGAGSILDSGSSLTLGAAAGGTSDLTISNGGVVRTSPGGDGSIGSNGDITALVTGSGSQLLVDGLAVGVPSGNGAGQGRLTIQNGGLTAASSGMIGSGANGFVTVTGPGSTLQSGSLLQIGSPDAGTIGHGELTIDNGGLVAASMVAMSFNGDGTVVGSSSALTVRGTPGARGVLETAALQKGFDDASATFDGGVLRASADSTSFIFSYGGDFVTIGGGGMFVDSNGFDVTASSGLSGAGTLTKQGAGVLTLSGANTYLGGTTIEAGTLQLGDGGMSGSIVGDVVDNGTLAFNRLDDVTFAGLITGSGGVDQNGAGTTILTGPNSYTGATNVNAGILRINGDQSNATGLTTVNSGATLGGSGTIGGSVTVLDGGILAPGNSPGTLTINGNLSLAGGSVLNYEFGQANVVGGALNDLVNVGGNLTLDGTINVTVPTGGSFGPGIYRVFNYGGALTNNGLDLGSMPAGSDVTVQTAIAGQVNLVNTDGLTLNFWDGDAGPKFNNLVDGGSGTWRVGGGNNNWADMNGAVNADYAQDAFAVFAGTPGTVTIDNGNGNVRASGMQFASTGYVITGDPLTLTGAQAIVQVGDGSAASAGYTATIASELTGTSELVKTDLGTLALLGDNSYTGGTRIEGGILRLGNGGTSGSIIGDVVDNGTLVVNRSNAVTLDGAISGTGSLTKLGGGTLTLTGANSYAGGTLVGGGTVQVSSDANLGDVAGTLSLQGGTLQAGASFTSTRTVLLGSTNANSIDTQGFDVTLGGTISDGPNNSSGDFVNKLGSGTLTLTGANTYANRTIVAGGTLALAGQGTIGAGNLVIGSAMFDISQVDTSARVIQLSGTAADSAIALGSKTLVLGFGSSFTDWTGTIADGGIGGGTGGSVVIQAPGGAVRFYSANSYTGGTNVNSGTFVLTGNGSLYAGGAVGVNSGAVFDISTLTAAGTTIGDLSGGGTVSLGGKTLTLGTANSTAFTGLITGTDGSIVKNGTGTFTLSGANNYTGATTVNAGTLLVNGNQIAATGLTSISSGATLGGIGTIGGDVTVADGGTLAPGVGGAGALTINGNLSLASGSSLAYDFGAANAVGSPLNDVVNVGGNLTLDGTINVAVTPGGDFGIGLYRVVNYGGTLTDNGLEIGTTPAGADVSVQTSVANQVNLINTGGATLNFWDGAAGPKFNNAVDGGDGVWQNGSGNDNWADMTGAVNAGYASGSIAIFSAAPGTVTVDDSLGAVIAGGMQFASDGYTITGDALTLNAVQSLVRVGDGTAAGAGYTATVDAELTGTARLLKADLGTLVLTGTNSYTGGTSIIGGTVRVSRDANLGDAAGGLDFEDGALETTADMVSARAVGLFDVGGTIVTDVDTTLTLTGTLTGVGNLAKGGTGTLVLGGIGSYTGATNVGAGTLLVNGDYSAATGATTIGAGASLGGTGTIGGSVTLADGAILTPGAGGAGTLTIGGDLFLSGGTELSYQFGQAGVAGGGLNDLVNVGGNLTLDGTIDVTETAGGTFGPGIYRVINYGGTLTDNGLTLGGLPAGSNVIVQTSVAGQVNLINAAGATLNFWDGAAGPKNDGVINGGNGVWQSNAGNNNWTDADGIVNGGYSDGAFAVFQGTGGTVTVDNSLGQVNSGGMQFAASGYTIAGQSIALTDPQTTIRVGDGSTAGAGFTATINAVLSGDTQLVKTDAGTLVLGGANTFTGGVAINGGTVQVASDTNLGAATGGVSLANGTLATSADITSGRNVTMAGAGTISTADATTFTLNGQIAGTGALTKAGAGTLLLTSDNSAYTAATSITGGTLAVTGKLGGAVAVNGGTRLEGTGSVGAVTNAGTVAPGRNGFGTLTTTGYTGAGGKLEIEAALGDDASQTDLLVVNGATAGTTEVDVTNRGGLGAQTVNGIKIIDVTGASNGTFALRGDYVFGGQQAVIAGAYGYRLYQGGVSTPTDGDWYLRSALLNPSQPTGPATPLYQPGVPVYEAYGQTLLSLTDLGTLQQRLGDRQQLETLSGKPSGIWGRMESKYARPNAAFSTSSADIDTNSWKAELGTDQVLSERGDGSSLVVGVIGSYGQANANIASIFGNGSIKTKAYSAGATLTWFGPQGFYADGRAQFTWFDSKLKSSVLGKLADSNKGTGQAYSVEVGKRTPVAGSLSVTPQIQMVYSTVGFDAFTDPNGAMVSSGLGDSLKTRWGLSIDRQDATSHLYAVGNISYEWLDGTVTDVSGTPIAHSNDRLWGELGVGGSVLLGGRVTLYTEGSANTALHDFGNSYSLKGTVGLRLAF